jgi:hypothetical protein
MLNPGNDSNEKAFGNIAVQGCFSASPAKVPGGVSAEQAAYYRDWDKQPRYSAVGNEPEEEEVSASWNRQRNGGRIEDCNSEESEWSQVGEPLRQDWVMGARRDRLSRLRDERAHAVLKVF